MARIVTTRLGHHPDRFSEDVILATAALATSQAADNAKRIPRTALSSDVENDMISVVSKCHHAFSWNKFDVV